MTRRIRNGWAALAHGLLAVAIVGGRPALAADDAGKTLLVGFVTPDGDVWGRPVGVAVAKDGSLMVTDDGSGTVWRVAFVGKARTP
jgi:glucose/arabinose dehydrogenase